MPDWVIDFSFMVTTDRGRVILTVPSGFAQMTRGRLNKAGLWVAAYAEDRYKGVVLIEALLLDARIKHLRDASGFGTYVGRALSAEPDAHALADQIMASAFPPMARPGTVSVQVHAPPGTARALDAPRVMSMITPDNPAVWKAVKAGDAAAVNRALEPDYASLLRDYVRNGGIERKEKMLQKVTLTVAADGSYQWSPDPEVRLPEDATPHLDSMKLPLEEYLKSTVPAMKRRSSAWVVHALGLLAGLLAMIAFLVAGHWPSALLMVVPVLVNALLTWKGSQKVPPDLTDRVYLPS